MKTARLTAHGDMEQGQRKRKAMDARITVRIAPAIVCGTMVKAGAALMTIAREYARSTTDIAGMGIMTLQACQGTDIMMAATKQAIM